MILVVGQPRTGTTAVARILHHLGCPMGTAMRIPLPTPGADYDFEDWAAVSCVLRGEKVERWWPPYEERRRGDYRQMKSLVPVAAQWGVKSPFLGPLVTDIRKLAKEPVHVILCTRGKASRRRSLHRQVAHVVDSQAVAEFVSLSESFAPTVPEPDRVIAFERLREDGEAVAQELGALVETKFDPTRVYLDVARHWGES